MTTNFDNDDDGDDADGIVCIGASPQLAFSLFFYLSNKINKCECPMNYLCFY